jgi:hypothetical protein
VATSMRTSMGEVAWWPGVRKSSIGKSVEGRE